MGSINFTFLGICTNFREAYQTTLPVSHRIVLVSTRASITMNNVVIPPHYASMVCQNFILPLNGCTIQVANPANSAITYDSTFDTLPNLTTLTNGAIGPTSQDVLCGKDMNLVSAWFDFNSGSFSACMNGLSNAQTMVTVETDGDPILMVTPFPTEAWPNPESQTFSPGSGVVVQNAALDEQNAQYHFWLNYRTAANLPSELPFADTSNMLPTLFTPTIGGVPILEGFGCSNASYP